MKKSRSIICLMLFVMFGLKVQAQEKHVLKLIATTSLPGFTGALDHFGVDLEGKRLFLTAEDHKTVEVFDLQTGKRIKSIPGFEQPHSIVYLPDSNNFIVADGHGHDMGTVKLLSGKDYSILKTMKLHPGVDAAVFNPVNQYYYVVSDGDEGGTTRLNIIDTKTSRH
jgi:DNA-binding beta-propeller fold protein YncE